MPPTAVHVHVWLLTQGRARCAGGSCCVTAAAVARLRAPYTLLLLPCGCCRAALCDPGGLNLEQPCLMRIVRGACTELAVLLSVSAVPVFRDSWCVCSPPSWFCACPYGLAVCGLAPVQLFPPLRPASRALAALLAAAQRRSWHSLLPVSGQQHMPPLNNIDVGSAPYLQCPVLSDGDAVVSQCTSQSIRQLCSEECWWALSALSVCSQATGWAAPATPDSHAVRVAHMGRQDGRVLLSRRCPPGCFRSAVILWCCCGLVVVVKMTSQ